MFRKCSRTSLTSDRQKSDGDNCDLAHYFSMKRLVVGMFTDICFDDLRPECRPTKPSLINIKEKMQASARLTASSFFHIRVIYLGKERMPGVSSRSSVLTFSSVVLKTFLPELVLVGGHWFSDL